MRRRLVGSEMCIRDSTQTASAVPKYFPLSAPVLYWLSHLTCISSLKAKNEQKKLIFTQLKISRHNEHFFTIFKRIHIQSPPTLRPIHCSLTGSSNKTTDLPPRARAKQRCTGLFLVSRARQAWSSESPRGQWRTGKNGENWLQNHLWCPNDPRG